MKSFILFITLAVSISCYSQITERKIARQPTIFYSNNSKYDSTQNIKKHFKPEEYIKYIGLKMIFCPKNNESPSTYKNCKNLYYYSDTNIEFIEKYNNLVNRSDLTNSELSIDSMIVYNGNPYFFISDTSKRRYLLSLNKSDHGTSDIILLPYLNYIKKKYIGMKFRPSVQIRNTNENSIYDLTDINTGNEMVVNMQDIFVCTGVDFMDASYKSPLLNPFLILKRDDGAELRISFYDKLFGAHLAVNASYRPNIKLDFISLANIKRNEDLSISRRSELIEKYGAKNGLLIFNKKVAIGMTKAMCVDSWGNPLKVNRTVNANTISEQWVYGSNLYLYFENNILVTIQD